MKKLAGFLIALSMSCFTLGHTFTLVPLRPVTAPIAVINSNVNTTIQVNVIHFDFLTLQIVPSPGANVSLQISYPGLAPTTLNAVADAQGNAFFQIAFPSPRPATMQYTASATWNSMTGSTIAPTIALPSTGNLPNPAVLPLLVQ